MRPRQPVSPLRPVRKPEKIGRNSHDVLVGIFGNVVRSLVRSSKPVIAAVNVRFDISSRCPWKRAAARCRLLDDVMCKADLSQGVAAGAGASLALAADFRVMSTDASILQAFVNVALVQDGAAACHLTCVVTLPQRARLSSSLALWDIAERWRLLLKVLPQLLLSHLRSLVCPGKPVPAARCLELGLANKVP